MPSSCCLSQSIPAPLHDFAHGLHGAHVLFNDISYQPRSGKLIISVAQLYPYVELHCIPEFTDGVLTHITLIEPQEGEVLESTDITDNDIAPAVDLFIDALNTLDDELNV